MSTDRFVAKSIPYGFEFLTEAGECVGYVIKPADSCSWCATVSIMPREYFKRFTNPDSAERWIKMCYEAKAVIQSATDPSLGYWVGDNYYAHSSKEDYLIGWITRLGRPSAFTGSYKAAHTSVVESLVCGEIVQAQMWVEQMSIQKDKKPTPEWREVPGGADYVSENQIEGRVRAIGIGAGQWSAEIRVGPRGETNILYNQSFAKLWVEEQYHRQQTTKNAAPEWRDCDGGANYMLAGVTLATVRSKHGHGGHHAIYQNTAIHCGKLDEARNWVENRHHWEEKQKEERAMKKEDCEKQLFTADPIEKLFDKSVKESGAAMGSFAGRATEGKQQVNTFVRFILTEVVGRSTASKELPIIDKPVALFDFKNPEAAARDCYEYSRGVNDLPWESLTPNERTKLTSFLTIFTSSHVQSVEDTTPVYVLRSKLNFEIGRNSHIADRAQRADDLEKENAQLRREVDFLKYRVKK